MWLQISMAADANAAKEIDSGQRWGEGIIQVNQYEGLVHLL